MRTAGVALGDRAKLRALASTEPRTTAFACGDIGDGDRSGNQARPRRSQEEQSPDNDDKGSSNSERGMDTMVLAGDPNKFIVNNL